MDGVQAVTIVPPGQSAPFARVTDTDHRAWILIASALGTALALSALVLRVIIRRFVIAGWSADDTTITISSVSACV